MKEIIKQLTEAYGPPGQEQAVREIIKAHVEPYADRIEVDPLGNLHVVKNGTGDGLIIMLAAHMDEIGLMVSHVNEKGFARFTLFSYKPSPTYTGSIIRLCSESWAQKINPFELSFLL